MLRKFIARYAVFEYNTVIRDELGIDYRNNDNYRRGRDAAISFRRSIVEKARSKWEEVSANVMLAQQEDPIYRRAILKGFARLRIERKRRLREKADDMPT